MKYWVIYIALLSAIVTADQNLNSGFENPANAAEESEPHARISKRFAINTGPGQGVCSCPNIYKPVCDSKFKEYANACEARCHGVLHHQSCRLRGQGISVDPSFGKETCNCPQIYQPVCGTDRKTYSSKCFAKCAHVGVMHEGECDPKAWKSGNNKEGPCNCPQIYDPVCGTDRQTYQNKCSAKCANVGVLHKGECDSKLRKSGNQNSEPCFCTQIYDPVCGEDRQTYNNKCLARCAGVKVLHVGKCKGSWRQGKTVDPGTGEQPCSCNNIYDPVCGTDRKTYTNKCMAKCARVGVMYKGPCDPNLKKSGGACACPKDHNPVCGRKGPQPWGKTYANMCKMRCHGAIFMHMGVCTARG